MLLSALLYTTVVQGFGAVETTEQLASMGLNTDITLDTVSFTIGVHLFHSIAMELPPAVSL